MGHQRGAIPSSTYGKNGYVTWDAESLYVGFDGVNIDDNSGWNQAVLVALDIDPRPGLSEGFGDSTLPANQWLSGSPVHLPFNADILYSAKAALTRTLTIPGSETGVYCRRKRSTTQDMTPPAAPATVEVPPIGDSICLTWEAVLSDTLGSPEQIAYYDVYRDTVPFFHAEGESFLEATDDTTYLDRMPPGGPVFYQVLAWDQAGNQGIPSVTVGRIEFQLGDESVEVPQQSSARNGY